MAVAPLPAEKQPYTWFLHALTHGKGLEIMAIGYAPLQLRNACMHAMLLLRTLEAPTWDKLNTWPPNVP